MCAKNVFEKEKEKLSFFICHDSQKLYYYYLGYQSCSEHFLPCLFVCLFNSWKDGNMLFAVKANTVSVQNGPYQAWCRCQCLLWSAFSVMFSSHGESNQDPLGMQTNEQKFRSSQLSHATSTVNTQM